MICPEDVDVIIPAGSDIVAQMHYHRTGKLETDSSQIGLWIEQNTKTRQMQRPDKDKCKCSREDRVAEDRDSEFRIQRRQSPKDDSDGSKQYPNNTKTAVAVATARRVAVGAIRGATKGRVTEPITAAEHAVGASGWALWVVSAG